MKKGKTKRSMRRFHNHNWDLGMKRRLRSHPLVDFIPRPYRDNLFCQLVQHSQLRWWNYPPRRGKYKPRS